MRRRLPAVCLGMVVLLPGMAPAQDKHICELKQLASLDITTEPDGQISIPATIDGHKGLLLVDTGGVQSVLGETVASQLALTVKPSPNPFMLYGGIRLDKLAVTHSFALGEMTAKDMPLLLAPFTALHDDDIGTLAPDIMSNYDVEFDFFGGKFNLFEPSFCRPTPVYWTKQPIAVVPFDVDRDGHIEITLALDGKSLTAVVDTGADRTTMSLAAFERIFGKTKDDPAMAPPIDVSINGLRTTHIYHYPFKVMTLEGVEVQMPNVDIVERGFKGDSGPALTLGIETLRQLRMYIAYKAERIYLTGAEAH